MGCDGGALTALNERLGPLVAAIAGEIFYGVRVVGEVHIQEGNGLFREGRTQLLDLGQLFSGAFGPGSPESDQERFAVKTLAGDFLTIEIVRGKTNTRGFFFLAIPFEREAAKVQRFVAPPRWHLWNDHFTNE